jgi:hypothetical protein
MVPILIILAWRIGEWGNGGIGEGKPVGSGSPIFRFPDSLGPGLGGLEVLGAQKFTTKFEIQGRPSTRPNFCGFPPWNLV